MKTTKRLISSILAVLLILSAIPLTAMAAGEIGSITLSAVTLSEEILIGDPDDPIDLFSDDGGPGVLAERAEASLSGSSSTKRFTVEEVQEAAGKLNALPGTPTKGSGTQDDPYEVAKGENVYLAINLNVTDPSKGGFLQGTMPIVQYAVGAFENPTAVANPMVTGELISRGRPPLTGANNYFPGATAFTVTGTLEANSKDKDGNSADRYRINFANASGYLPNAATWDVLVKLTATGTGVQKIEIAPEITNSHGASFVSKIGYNEAGWGDSNYDIAGNDTANAGKTLNDVVISQPIYVEIVSSTPTIDIAAGQKLNPVNNATIDVAVTKGSFTDTTASKYHVMNGTTEISSAVTKVVAGTGKATLTIDATKLTAGDEYTIKVDSDTITGTTENLTDAAETTNKFTVKAAISGTPSISGTAEYGKTLTATHNTNATTPAYQWYRGTDKISGATNSTYKLVAADIGKTITVEVSDSTGTVYGTAKATATSAVEKVTLARPASGKLGTAATATQDVGATADVTKEGIYTFTTGVVSGDTVTMKFDAVYTADMLKTAGSKTGLAATLKGDLLGANGATDANVTKCYKLADANSETYTADGSVSAAGYKLKGDNDMTFKDSSDTTIAADTVVAGGTEIKVTYDMSKVPSDKELSGFTVKVGTGAAGTTGITSVDTTAGTFTYTTPAGSVTEALDVVFAPTFGTAATPVEFTGLDKTYDGTDAFKGSISTAGVTMSDFNITVKYDGEDFGASLTITGDDAGQVVTIKGTDYRVPSTLTGTIKKTTAAVSVNTGTGKIAADAGIDTVVAKIKEASVKIEGVEKAQGTVGDYFTNDETIMNAIKTKYPDVYTEGDPGKQPSTEELSADKTIDPDTDEVIKGTKFVLPSDATLNGEAITAATEAAGLSFTVGEDGKITVEITGEVTAETAIKFSSDANTLTIPALTPVEPVAATEAGWDFSSLAGKNIEIELTLSDADTKTGALFTNVDTDEVTTLAVTAPINRKGQPVVSGSVNFDTQGYGTAEFDTADINGDGKLDALPTMTTKVGLEFRGWSTDGTEAHIVNLETYKPDANEENTLVAVVRGYMVGDGKGKVRPTANITRKELAKMLVVAAGVYDSSVDYTKDPANLFPDMPHDGWSDNYLACAKKFGIMKGNEAGKGTPNANITRNEAAAMIARVFGVKTSADDTTDKVNDFDKVDSWAKEYVAALCNNGTINGKPDGSFSGKMNIQRSEAAKMVNIYLGLDDAKKATIKSDETIKNPFTDIVGDSTWAYADLMFASKSVPASFYVDEITVPEAK